jgi:hypothetical protein
MSQYIYVTHASKIKTEGKAEGMGIFFTWGVELNLHTMNAVDFLHNGKLPLKNGKKRTYGQMKKVTNGKYLPEIFWEFTIFGNIFETSHGKVQLSSNTTNKSKKSTKPISSYENHKLIHSFTSA